MSMLYDVAGGAESEVYEVDGWVRTLYLHRCGARIRPSCALMGTLEARAKSSHGLLAEGAQYAYKEISHIVQTGESAGLPGMTS
jgi:hypothetical protein